MMPTDIQCPTTENGVAEGDSVGLAFLPSDVIQVILSFMQLEEIHASLRPACISFQNACDTDSRWLPVIAPPSLAHEVLNLERHGHALRRLRIRDYKKWRDRWETCYENVRKRELLEMKSALDGFFSLAPWRQHSSASYPTPWLHQMVYNQDCPTILPPDASVSFSIPGCHDRKDHEKSKFFQQRERLVLSRTFITRPIEPDLPILETPVRILLQPVNFRKWKDGSKRDDLPDHVELEFSMDACMKVLECYFGAKQVILRPLIEHHTNLGENCRKDPQGRLDGQGRAVVQIDAGCLNGLSSSVLDNVKNAVDGGKPSTSHDLIIYIIAPHMYSRDAKSFAWMFSTYVYLRHDLHRPWVMSTFQFRRETSAPKQRIRQYTSAILTSALMQLKGVYSCENAFCALNNADFIGEAEAYCRLILCSACIRKVQLCGILDRDVPAFHRRLHGVLTQEPFIGTSRGDACKLEDYV